MHPVLARKKWLGLYLAAWLPVALLVATLVSLAGPAPWTHALILVLPLAAFYAFQCLPVWYLCRSFPLQSSGLFRIAAVISVAAVISASLWMFVGSGWALLLARSFRFAGTDELFRRSYPVLFAAGALLFVLAAFAGYLLVAAEASRTAERKVLEMKILAQEAELRALRAQIHPHFLFNSLNSVVSLIGSDAAEARRMSLLLADFLRSSLKAASMGSIPLAEELALLGNFLEIERIRFGSRLQVRLDVDEESRSCPIPPLLLQPLIENAVNHGIAQRIEGGEISLHAERHGSRLSIRIVNPCDPDRPKSAGKGIGLANVHARLAAHYGNEARLDTYEKDGCFHAELRMPA